MAVRELTTKLVAAQQRIAELEEGLEPFARSLDEDYADVLPLVVCPDEFGETLQVGITIGHCRRAAELLKTKGVGV
jgi:hypothetical protein